MLVASDVGAVVVAAGALGADVVASVDELEGTAGAAADSSGGERASIITVRVLVAVRPFASVAT